MSNDHDSYRPQSPDLPTYKPQPPPLSSFEPQPTYPGSVIPTHRASFDASPYFSPQTPLASHSYFPQQPFPPQHVFSPQSVVSPQPQSYIQAPIEVTALPPRISTQAFHQRPFGSSSTIGDMPRKRASDDEDEVYAPEASAQAGRASKKRRSGGASQPSASRSGSGPSQGIEVKTKFPVARIKRIMQADEDVGKVAQATPTAVSKALELFMINLVTKAAGEAKNRSSKRITAAHLKQAVLADTNLDFLVDIVDKVPDPTEKKGRAKSEDSAEHDEGVKKRRGVGVGRRKAADTDED